MTEKLSPIHIPDSWIAQEGSDFHVAIFKDSPNSFIFAPQYNTIDLLDDCVCSATLFGAQLIKNKQCDVFEITYMYESNTKIWNHIKLTLCQTQT